MSFTEACFPSTDTINGGSMALHAKGCDIASSTHQTIGDVLDMNQPLSAGFIAPTNFDETYPNATDQGNVFDKRFD